MLPKEIPSFHVYYIEYKRGFFGGWVFLCVCGITELLTSLFLVKEMFLHFGKSESDPVVLCFLRCFPTTLRVTILPLPTQKTTRVLSLLNGLPSTSKPMSTEQMTSDNLDKTHYSGLQMNASAASTHWFYALCIYNIKKK